MKKLLTAMIYVDRVMYYNFDVDFVSLSPFDILNHVKSDPRTYISYLDL